MAPRDSEPPSNKHVIDYSFENFSPSASASERQYLARTCKQVIRYLGVGLITGTQGMRLSSLTLKSVSGSDRNK